MSEPSLLRTDEELNPVTSVFADIVEGLEYLRKQPRVFALGITYACMMAGVISANVLVVALAKNLLSVGARGYGWIEAGWAVGAIIGGLAAGAVARKRPYSVLILALATWPWAIRYFPTRDSWPWRWR